MTERKWFKWNYFWRHPDSSNAGDLIFNTCDKAIRDDDFTLWAYESLNACQDLLWDGVRWPIILNEPDTAKTWMQYRWSKLLKNGRYSRPRQILTRDPNTAFYANCVRLGHRAFITETPPAWYNYNASFWSFYKYLITHDAKYLRRYRFLDKFSTSKKEYVIRLRQLREIAIQGL